MIDLITDPTFVAGVIIGCVLALSVGFLSLLFYCCLGSKNDIDNKGVHGED